MISYKKQDIINEFENYYRNSFNPNLFYRKGFLNRSGYTIDTHEPYTEILIELMFQYGIIKRLNNEIHIIHRNKTYNIQSHLEQDQIKPNKGSNQTEKNNAKSIIGRISKGYGKILNYEIPLVDKKDDIGGEIDLISYDEDSHTAFLLELKAPKAKDTLLRCSMEVYNYKCRVDVVRLLEDFKLPPVVSIVPAILLYDDCVAAKEFHSLDKRPYLKRLIDELGIQVFFLP